MKAVIQRVRKASVETEGRIVGEIDRGLVVLLGIAKEDDRTDVDFIAQKLPALRIFSDEMGKMNKSLCDIGGAFLIISQFTLLADLSRGRRPSFEEAAPPEYAKSLYQNLIDRLRESRFRTEAGVFGTTMVVSLENDGPVTLVLDSRMPEKVKRG